MFLIYLFFCVLKAHKNMHLGNTECLKGEKFVDGITNGAAWYAGTVYF